MTARSFKPIAVHDCRPAAAGQCFHLLLLAGHRSGKILD